MLSVKLFGFRGQFICVTICKIEHMNSGQYIEISIRLNIIDIRFFRFCLRTRQLSRALSSGHGQGEWREYPLRSWI